MLLEESSLSRGKIDKLENQLEGAQDFNAKVNIKNFINLIKFCIGISEPRRKDSSVYWG